MSHGKAAVAYRDVSFSPASMSKRHIGPRNYIQPKPRGMLKSDWNKRYTLFSKFDFGIEMDSEAWFEVTPENIARYISARIPFELGVVDGFCGVGGNAIQFAFRHSPVIAVDISNERMKICRNNAAIYDVSNRISFETANVERYLASMDRSEGLCFYASPPWGGKSCYEKNPFTMDCFPVDLARIIRSAINKMDSLVLHLPRHLDIDNLAYFLGSIGVEYFEVERIYFSEPEKRLKCVLVFIDQSRTARNSVLFAGREIRRDSIASFLGCGPTAIVWTQAFIRIGYLGRFISSAFRRDGFHGVKISPLSPGSTHINKLHFHR
jgi:hypothetical protein